MLGRRLAGAMLVLAIALSGCGGSDGEQTAAGTSADENGVAMPDLIGMTVDEASAALNEAQPAFNLKIAYGASRKPRDRVFAQSPAPGTPLPADKLYRVRLSISKGKLGLCGDYEPAQRPEGVDCDPRSGKFVIEGEKCQGFERDGAFRELKCLEPANCGGLHWARKEQGAHPVVPFCKKPRPTGQSLTPGAPCDPDKPLPPPFECKPK
jgi:PASTA domain-containing protein